MLCTFNQSSMSEQSTDCAKRKGKISSQVKRLELAVRSHSIEIINSIRVLLGSMLDFQDQYQP